MRPIISTRRKSQIHLDRIAAHAKMVDFQARHTYTEEKPLVWCPISRTFSKAYTVAEAQRAGLISAEARLAEVVVGVLVRS